MMSFYQHQTGLLVSTQSERPFHGGSHVVPQDSAADAVQLIIENLPLSDHATHVAGIRSFFECLSLVIPGVDIKQLLESGAIFFDKGLPDKDPARQRRQHSIRLKWNHQFTAELPASPLEIFDRIRVLVSESKSPGEIRWANAPTHDRATRMIASVSKTKDSALPRIFDDNACKITLDYLRANNARGPGCLSDPGGVYSDDVEVQCFTSSYRFNSFLIMEGRHEWGGYNLTFEHVPRFIPVTFPTMIAVYIGEHMTIKENVWRETLDDIVLCSHYGKPKDDLGRFVHENWIRYSGLSENREWFTAVPNSMEAAAYIIEYSMIYPFRGTHYELVFAWNERLLRPDIEGIAFIRESHAKKAPLTQKKAYEMKDELIMEEYWEEVDRQEDLESYLDKQERQARVKDIEDKLRRKNEIFEQSRSHLEEEKKALGLIFETDMRILRLEREISFARYQIKKLERDLEDERAVLDSLEGDISAASSSSDLPDMVHVVPAKRERSQEA